jgi:hypothetical protein
MKPEIPDTNQSPDRSVVFQESFHKTDDVIPSKEFQQTRIQWGYWLIALSIVLFLAIIVCSIAFVESLEPRSSAPYVFDYVRLAARAILTAASAVFSYKILRAGERMIMPLTLVKSSEDLRLILGAEKTLPKKILDVEILTKYLTTKAKRIEDSDIK